MTRYVIAALAGILYAAQEGPRLLHLAAALAATNLILWTINRLRPTKEADA